MRTRLWFVAAAAALVGALAAVPLGNSCALFDPDALKFPQPEPVVAKNARTQNVIRREAPKKPHPNPVVKFGYRHLALRNIDGSNLGFNSGSIDAYAVSRRWFRFGFEAEAGGASGFINDMSLGPGAGTIVSAPMTAWYAAVGLLAGFQYPARVTPFVEGRFIAGAIGGDIAGQSAVSYTYMGGLDAGIELYLVGRFYLTASVGWVRPSWRGPDVDYMRTHNGEMRLTMLTTDSFTFKVGFGL
jgi:hypothetical protein